MSYVKISALVEPNNVQHGICNRIPMLDYAECYALSHICFYIPVIVL